MSTARQLATLARMDALMLALSERANAALASQRAALETLESIPAGDAQARSRFLAIVVDEGAALAEVIERASRDYTAARIDGWPMEPILAGELLSSTAVRVQERLGIPVTVSTPDAPAWLRVEGYPLAQALSCVASRLRHEHGIAELRLAASVDDKLVRLRVGWPGAPLSIETWQAWERQPLRFGGEPSHFTLGEVLRRHGGEAWHSYDAPSARGHIDVVLPSGKP